MKDIFMMVSTLVAAVLSLVWSTAPAAAQSTDGEVAENLFHELVLPVEAALAEAGATGITMRAPASTSTKLVSLLGPIQERIGNFLYERGYDVHTLEAGAEAPDDIPLFEFEVDAAGFDYPSKRAGFLGLGSETWLRRGALGIRGRIQDPRNGQWLWTGSPRLVKETWVPASDVEALAEDRPAWMSERPLVRPEGRSVWWERSLMAGLIAGVVILYADGTQ